MAKLGEIATYINGYPFKPEDWSDDGVPIIRIQDLSGNSYQTNRYNGKYAPKYEVNDGDVLISWSASLGVYIWHGEKAVLNQHIFKVVFDKAEVDKSFFVHQVGEILEKAAASAHGATMKHLTKPVFDALPFYLPPIEEQRRIASVLDKVTDLIAQRRAQLDKLDLLVKSRFVEMFGEENKYTTAEKACNTIVDCPHSTPRYTGQDKIYPSIRTSEIKNGQIDWTTMLYVDIEEYESRTKRLKPMPGDIVYAREGTYGDCVILPEHHKFCLGQRTMLFRPDYSICTSEYLHQALRSNAVKRQADESNAGSTVPHVNVADAKKFTFPLPPLAKQKTFSVTMQKTNQIKNHINRSLEWLEVLKKSLMQQYFE